MESIGQKYKLAWDSEQMKYLGVYLTKELGTLYEVNFNKINEEIQKI